MTTTEVSKLFKDTFSGAVGQKCLAQLKKTFIDREIYKQGMSLEDAALRQGEYNVIMKIIREVER